MQTLRVKNWPKYFENNRTRELKWMEWVPIQNKMDGDGFTELLDHPNGIAHYGAWMLIVLVASKCDVRGTLLRDGARPHDSHSLARVTRGSQEIFEEVIPRLLSIGWLEVIPSSSTDCHNPAPSCENPAQRRDTVTTERNGTERNGRGGERSPLPDSIEIKVEDATPPPGELPLSIPPTSEVKADAVPRTPSSELKSRAVLLLTFLNETADRRYVACDESLKPIMKRLMEGHEVGEIKKMIVREVTSEGRDSKWLRPQTLFGANFHGAFGDRDLPPRGGHVNGRDLDSRIKELEDLLHYPHDRAKHPEKVKELAELRKRREAACRP